MKKVIFVAVSAAAIFGLGACTGDDKAVSVSDVRAAIDICSYLAGEKNCEGDATPAVVTTQLVATTEPAPVVVNNYDSPAPAPIPSRPAPSPEPEPANVSVVAHAPVKIDGPPTDAKPVPGDESVYYYFKGGRCKLASQGEPSDTAKAFHRKGCPDTVS